MEAVQELKANQIQPTVPIRFLTIIRIKLIKRNNITNIILKSKANM